MSFMHARAQAKTGGETLFCDGFMVAERLRREHPELYDLLLQTEVMFVTFGKDIRTDLGYYSQSYHPVIRYLYTASVTFVCTQIDLF